VPEPQGQWTRVVRDQAASELRTCLAPVPLTLCHVGNTRMVATSRGQLRGRANKAVEVQRRGPRREFERLLGRRQMGVEILQAAQDVIRKSMVTQRVREVTGHPVAAICRTLRLARQTAYYTPTARAWGHYQQAADVTVLQQIHAVTNSRATSGYRRVWAMVNRQFRAGYNRKCIRRVMRMHGLMRAPRVRVGVGRSCRWSSPSIVTIARSRPGWRRRGR